MQKYFTYHLQKSANPIIYVHNINKFKKGVPSSREIFLRENASWKHRVSTSLNDACKLGIRNLHEINMHVNASLLSINLF